LLKVATEVKVRSLTTESKKKKFPSYLSVRDEKEELRMSIAFEHQSKSRRR
jgi:hypothetical protein